MTYSEPPSLSEDLVCNVDFEVKAVLETRAAEPMEAATGIIGPRFQRDDIRASWVGPLGAKDDRLALSSGTT